MSDSGIEHVGSKEFRAGLRTYLDAVQFGDHQIEIIRIGKRAAVVVNPRRADQWRAAERSDGGLCAFHLAEPGMPSCGYLTRDQLADELDRRAVQLGGPTVELTKGEMRLIIGVLAEVAARYPAERFGHMAAEWLARFERRNSDS